MARSFIPIAVVAGLLYPACGFAESNAAPQQSKKVVQVEVVQAAGGAVAVRSYGSSSLTDQVRRDVDPQDNVERLLLLLPGGPVVAEVRITLDGKPFRVARETLVDELLAEADTDGDGKPTWKEAVENPRFGFGRFASQSARTQLANEQQLQGFLASYDSNKDGLVDRYEARLVAARLGNGAAFRATTNPYAGAQPDVKSVLDTDKDGSMTAEELAAAEERLKSRDANDNDLLEANEVGGTGTATRYGNVIRVRGGRGVATQPSVVFLLGPEADLAAVDRELRRRYGSGDEKTLTAESFPLIPNLVAQLDTNENGELDTGEAVGFQLLDPQIVLEVNLGEKTDDVEPGVRLVSLAPELQNSDAVNAQLAAEQSLALPGVQVKLAAAAGSPYRNTNYEQFARQILDRLDADKNGYLEKKELEDNNNARGYLTQFETWDADGDGKVFGKEITESYTRALRPLLSQVSLTAAEQGPSIFAALDISGDNRLSLREMRTAGERLKSFDKNDDGQIGLEEMPSEIALNFGIGYSGYSRGGGFRVVQRGGRNTPQQTSPQAGPKWFIHMDRNGDGDVTQKEFLGTPEKFKELDTNGDGFIEPREAEAVAESQQDR